MRRQRSFHTQLFAWLQLLVAKARATLTSQSPAQGLVEYGLILVLIMVVCVGILSMVGETVSEVWYTKLINGVPW
jgi:cytochrome b